MRAIEVALRAGPPDVVIVQDVGAPGYSALRLRDLGLAFENTLFVVYCHGTRQWITNASRKVRVLPGALAVSRLEQATVELADVVVSPSAYMVEWMRQQGWRLPTAAVIPLLTRSAATGESPPQPVVQSNGAVHRLAFFGRLEERKGVRPFVAGLNALAPELLEGIEVEFLGRATTEVTPERVEALLSETARNALGGVSFETELDQHEALARLSRPGTVAFMPSLEDNSPAILRCWNAGSRSWQVLWAARASWSRRKSERACCSSPRSGGSRRLCSTRWREGMRCDLFGRHLTTRSRHSVGPMSSQCAPGQSNS